ncbi:MAG: alpha/beta hydrolase family protein [Planctomycetota bacterium]
MSNRRQSARHRNSTIVSRMAGLSLQETLAREAPVEEWVRFDSEGERVHGMLYLPAETLWPCPAVVGAHGFTGSRNADQRLFPWLGRALANHGIAVLNIDFRGSGESEGAFEDMTVAGEVADARRALDCLAADERIDAGRLGMTGHSLGGFVSVCTAAEDDRVRGLALWAAVGPSDEVLARLDPEAETRTRNGWDVGGLEVSQRFLTAFRAIDIAERFAASDCPVLVLHGDQDPSVPPEHASFYAGRAAEAKRSCCLRMLPGADHCFRSLEARADVIGTTLSWWMEIFGAGEGLPPDA